MAVAPESSRPAAVGTIFSGRRRSCVTPRSVSLPTASRPPAAVREKLLDVYCAVGNFWRVEQIGTRQHVVAFLVLRVDRGDLDFHLEAAGRGGFLVVGELGAELLERPLAGGAVLVEGECETAARGPAPSAEPQRREPEWRWAPRRRLCGRGLGRCRGVGGMAGAREQRGRGGDRNNVVSHEFT